MTKMSSMNKSAADKRAEKDTLGEAGSAIAQNSEDHDGPVVHLDHHHLKNMKVGGGLKSGHKVTIMAEGHVESADTRSDKSGDKHSARIRIHRMGMEHEGEKGEERADLRNEIEKIHGSSEKSNETGVGNKAKAAAK